jgi:alpha-L-fucosidase
MKINGQSIWATQASPFAKTPWGRCTQKELDSGNTRLYLHVFNWPANGKLVIAGLENRPVGASLLDGGQVLELTSADRRVTIVLPDAMPDKIDTVVALDIEGTPRIEPVLPSQRADGTITLPAVDATCHGQRIRYEVGPDRDNIGYWLDPNDWAQWQFQVATPGTFAISAEIAALGAGSFHVVVGGQKVEATSPITGDYGRFTVVSLGTIEIPQAGKTSLAVKAVPQGWEPLNLKSIVLKPTK